VLDYYVVVDALMVEDLVIDDDGGVRMNPSSASVSTPSTARNPAR
jgi:hypothetical protein